MKFDFIVRKDTPYRKLEFDRRQKILCFAVVDI